MNEKHYIPGLDGLRALALIAVFLFHLDPTRFPGGYLGVVFFFVLSGFLIEVRSHDMDIADVGGFLAKRILRILPPLVLVVFVSAGFLGLIAPYRTFDIRPEILSVLNGTNNFYQISRSQDYFANVGNGSLFTHMWSLAIEMQFYLIWPFIALIDTKIRRSDPKVSLLLQVVITVFLSAFMPFFYFAAEDTGFVYYSTLTRAFSLAIGVLAGRLHENNFIGPRWRKQTARYAWLAPALALGSVFLAALLLFYADGQKAFVYEGGMLVVSLWSAGLILLLAAGKAGKGLLENRFVRGLGRLGFEIYLWQYPVIYIMHLAFGHSFLINCAIVAITLFLSVWSHWFIGTLTGLPAPVLHRERKSIRRYVSL